MRQKMMIALILMMSFVLALLLFIAMRMVRDTPNKEELLRLRNREQELQTHLAQLNTQIMELQQIQVQKAKLETDLENERKSFTEKLELLQNAETRMKTEFENLANRIFEDKGKSLTDYNREHIVNLLQPFKEQLQSFRARVDELHESDTARSAKLIEQVKQLHQLSNKVSDEANHLANAIKGEAKTQGDWGELIVERILEASGLERGREFETQVGKRTADGTLQKPDFIVHLPGEKAVIVDSKVSLTAYERFANTEHQSDKEDALAEHLQSVRNHIKELETKDYSQLLGNKTLDFVIMCIPIEPAYQVAFLNDKKLIYDLAKGNVVISGPTTLMITLKLIAQIWRRENENKNSEDIANRAGRIYDQVALIVEAMQDAQKKLTGVSESFDLAMKRLTAGKGNLIGRVEMIRKLGAKVKKQLPHEMLSSSNTEE